MELHISETRMQTSVEVEVRVRISIFLHYRPASLPSSPMVSAHLPGSTKKLT